MKKDYEKALKNVALVLLSNLVPFNRQSYQKQKGSETSRSLGYKTTSKIFLYLLYIIWPSLMMQCKIVFELFQNLHLQIYASQFMNHKLFHFHLSLWIWKVWKGRKKITKSWISRERNKFFNWNKKHFYSFSRAII